MDLADRVIRANNESGRTVQNGFDELGLRIFEGSPDYLAARALRLNYLDRMSGKSSALLHTRNNKTELWLGDKWLTESPGALYRLTKYKLPLSPWLVVSAWEKLLEFAPALDETKLIIDAYTYWDIEKGELCHSDEALEAIE